VSRMAGGWQKVYRRRDKTPSFPRSLLYRDYADGALPLSRARRVDIYLITRYRVLINRAPCK